MVRLKNPMAGVGDDGPRRPAAYDDAALLARLDAALREEILGELGKLRGRVLVVGADWPELALELARRDRFVTLLDPRRERLAVPRDAALTEGLTPRLTLDARTYAEVDFEAASFEAIVLYDPFAYLGAPGPLFNKCRREMRAGGELFVRAAVSSGAPYPDTPPQGGITATAVEVPAPGEGTLRALALRDRVRDGVYRLLATTRLLNDAARARLDEDAPGRRVPDWATLEAALSEHFVLTRIAALHLASWELAELGCALRAPLGRAATGLVDLALRLDERLLEHPVARALAPVVLLQATKQRELGRVFLLRR